MVKPRKFFWCCNDNCVGWHQHIVRPPISECAQELQGKRLCKLCYDAGYRLKVETKVVARKPLDKPKP